MTLINKSEEVTTELTDPDDSADMEIVGGKLEGFLKGWGWLNFSPFSSC